MKKEPELKIFGMSTETQEEQRKSFQNSKQGFFSLDLLSDYHLSFSNFLELPKFKDQNGESRLKRLTLLFRGGQITRIDYSKKEMVEEVGIEGRILEMLRDDSELAWERMRRESRVFESVDVHVSYIQSFLQLYF